MPLVPGRECFVLAFHVTILTSPEALIVGNFPSRPVETPMAAKKTRKIVRTGLAIAATTLAEAALQQAAQNPRVRRKAGEMVASTGRALKRTVKKVAGKRGRKKKSSKARSSR
jgi:hypothetical protein